MAHSFLLKPGNWRLNGHWLEQNENPIPLLGNSLITWKQDQWFTIVTKLTIAQETERNISYKYKGYLDLGGKYYTYVLQHSILGNIEGEGWIGPQTIIQHYWVLGKSQRHTGFETFYRLSDDSYRLSGGFLAGHSLKSTLEATLNHQF